MSLLKSLAAGAVLAFAALAGPAFAKPAPPAAPPAAPAADTPEAHARRVALVNRYFAAVRLQRMMDTMTASMLPAMMDERSGLASLPPDAKAIVQDVVRESLRDFTLKVMARVAGMYADSLTEEELQAMVRFYESPTGQSITAKSARLTSMTGPLLREMSPGLKADVIARLCGRIDCAKAGLKPSGRAVS